MPPAGLSLPRLASTLLLPAKESQASPPLCHCRRCRCPPLPPLQIAGAILGSSFVFAMVPNSGSSTLASNKIAPGVTTGNAFIGEIVMTVSRDSQPLCFLLLHVFSACSVVRSAVWHPLFFSPGVPSPPGVLRGLTWCAVCSGLGGDGDSREQEERCSRSGAVSGRCCHGRLGARRGSLSPCSLPGEQAARPA